MSETFLSRWSRRKRAASIPPPQGEDGEDRSSEPGEGTSPPPAERAESPPNPDPLPASGESESLPPIESIDAGTDVSAFLRPGVPAELAQAALRRAWVTDPTIRDFVGPAENAWDFNAPGGVPGFEPLRAIDDVQRLAAQVLGILPSNPPQHETEKTQAVGECPQPAAQAAPAAQAPETEAPAVDGAATQKDASPRDL